MHRHPSLVAIFAFVATAIFCRAYFESNGAMSQDSTNYLGLAQNLLDGRGFKAAACGGFPEPSCTRVGEWTFFAVWPLGYPLCIAGAAAFTGLSVFWAAKLVNIVSVGLVLLGLWRQFGTSAPVLALLLLFAPFLVLVGFSLSEAPFLAASVWFCGALSRSTRHPRLSNLIELALASVLLFLFRYVGAFSLFAIWFSAGRHVLKRKFVHARRLVTASLPPLALMAGYLLHNVAVTGFATGVVRIPARESLPDKLCIFLEAALSSVNVFRPVLGADTNARLMFALTLLVEIILGAFVYKAVRAQRKAGVPAHTSLNLASESDVAFRATSDCYLYVGLLYLAVVAVLRWRSYMDPLGFRLLGPGTFLVAVGLVGRALAHWQAPVQATFRKVMGVAALASFLLNGLVVPLQKFASSHLTYPENMARLRQLYSRLPPGSVVAYPDWHLYYLRPDVYKYGANWGEKTVFNGPVVLAWRQRLPEARIFVQRRISVFTNEEVFERFVREQASANGIEIIP